MSILEVTVSKRVYDDTDTVEYIVIHLVEGVELGFKRYTRFDQVLAHLAELDETISLKIDFSVY
jgi:hypothetical protein